MFIKGIKKGKNIELLEEINLPDNQEVMIEIKQGSNFWTALQEFRQKVDLESLDDDTFENLRDKSIGKDDSLIKLCVGFRSSTQPTH